MNTRAKAVAVSTVGYMCLAITGWMLQMSNASWFSRQYGLAILYPLAILLAVMGILSFAQNRGLDSIVFFGGAGLLGTLGAYFPAHALAGAVAPASYLGWFACLWGIFFLYVWAGSFKSGVPRMLFLLALWLSLGCIAIGDWSGVGGWIMAGGYLGLISSVLAFVASGSEIVGYGRTTNPNLEVAGTAPRPMAAD